MDNNDITSAIDDSGATRVFGLPPPSTRSQAGPAFEYGRRSGHWTAGDTVFGSAIDDGCPTVVHLPHSHRKDGGGARLEPLSAEALTKLKKACEMDEKKKAAARAEEDAREREKAAATAAAAERTKESADPKSPPRAFYIPKRGMGIRIVGKDGKTEVVMRPQSVVKAPCSKPVEKPVAQTTPTASARPESVVKGRNKPTKASLQVGQPGPRRIKIVGKNGEEAFVELPALGINAKPKSTTPAPAPAIPVKVKKAAGLLADPPKQPSKQEVAEQQAKAAKAARELRAQRERQGKEEKEKRERQAEAAANALMAGALPGASMHTVAHQPDSVQSAKTTGTRSPSVLNGLFDNPSKAPSKVSSKTTAPPLAQVTSVREASHVSKHGEKSASDPLWQVFGSEGQRSQQSASNGGRLSHGGDSAIPSAACRPMMTEPTSRLPGQSGRPSSQQNSQQAASGSEKPFAAAANEPWEGTSAVYKMPSVAKQPAATRQRQAPPPTQRQKASTPPSRPISITSSQISRKVAGINQWNNTTPTVHSNVPSIRARSANSPLPPPLNIRRANNASQDTIFAGTGWISPHPLSRAPSELEPPPQDQISIQGATMTYEEWRRLQEQTNDSTGAVRRNFSRTSSEAKSVRDGHWGVGNVPASLRGPEAGGEDVGRQASGGLASNYHVPTVVSEHSQRSWQSHHTQRSVSTFDGTHIRSVRADSQQSRVSSHSHGGLDEPVPAVGYSGEQPQVDGAGAGSVVSGRMWREPESNESAASLRTLRGGSRESGGGKRRETVQLRMPWDREAVVGSEAGHY